MGSKELVESALRILRKHPEWKKYFKRIVEYHEEKKGEDYYKRVGFEWSDVGVPPHVLYTMFREGLLGVVFKTRSYTGYLPTDVEAIKESLKLVEALEGVEEPGEVEVVHGEIEVPDDLFSDIVGYEYVKDLFRRALKNKIHILMVGPPASAKSLFLESLSRLPGAELVLGSRVTRAGLADFLITRRPKILLIDELDKMTREDYAVLLSLCQTGLVKETLYGRRRSVKLDTVVFAAANDLSRIPAELGSRFQILGFDTYSYDEFKRIAENILPKYEGIPKDVASYIAEKVWNDLGSRDVRDAVKVARFVKDKPSREEVDRITRILEKYGAKKPYK